MDSSDEEYLTEVGRMIKKRIAHTAKPEVTEKKAKVGWTNLKHFLMKNPPKTTHEDNYEREPFSGLRIVNPLVSSATMKARMEGRKMVKMSLLHRYIKGGDIDGDWVTIGIVTHKSPPKTAKNGKAFSIWKMCDLLNCDKIVSLFLFGEVHQQHWKTSVGMVVGILNASFLPEREDKKSGEISMSIDHPGKLMLMGMSKDFGFCRGRRKDGQSCTYFVNLEQCEYCQYHVQSEYKKLSSKRSELQASYSGVQPRKLVEKVLNKQNVMYGGQMFSAPVRNSPAASRRKGKDQLTLESLKLKQKAQDVEIQQRQRPAIHLQHLDEQENKVVNSLAGQSDFFGEVLSTPTAGSRNLLKHMANDDQQNKVKSHHIKPASAKNLLEMHTQELKVKHGQQTQVTHHQTLIAAGQPSPAVTAATQAVMPQLGRGCKTGGSINLALNDNLSRTNVTKLRAIQQIKAKGKIEKENPNAVKKKFSPEVQLRVKRRLEPEKLDVNSISDIQAEPEAKCSRLGDISPNSAKFQEILHRKSSHAFEVEQEELEKQETYFSALEKKEQMEEKMTSITEISCQVVSCLKCKYTAPSPAQLCQTEQHPLKCHKALKRFFRCKNCDHRTVTFARIPNRACRNCGHSNYERTSMRKARQGPKLESEQLLLRGEERKFVNSHQR